MNVLKTAAVGISLCSALALLPSTVVSADAVSSVPLEVLREQVRSLGEDAVRIKEENRGLRQMLQELESDDLYLVVDIENTELTMRRSTSVVHTAVCGTGSHELVEEETGRNWFFETPIGSFTVIGKERNPVWIRPDWSYVEENMPIPPKHDPERLVRGVLGKYALLLGNGYKIHGTTYTNLLGTHFTHGCISLGDDDLAFVYKSVAIGTKVYIY